MATLHTSRTYDAPREAVFAIFADIEKVCEISPGIKDSKRLNQTQGKGAMRECDFGGGAGIHEEVTSFKENEQLQFTGLKIWGVPMKSMVATFDFSEQNGKTTVALTCDYNMKMGFLMNFMAKGMYKKSFDQMLAGADAKLQGKPIKKAAAPAA